MKRLLSLVIAIIAIVALAVPTFASVPAEVTVGGSGVAPEMIALAMTPDDSVAPGTQIDLEYAIPDNGSFASLSADQDGWKLVKFYVEAWHVNGPAAISSVAIDVNYPQEFNEYDDLYLDRAGDRKFEINAYRGAEGWTGSISYDFPEGLVYPDGTDAGRPGLTVRELLYPSVQDYVDICADDNPFVVDAEDLRWGPFLTAWGDKVSYYGDWDSSTAFTKFQGEQALVLELTGWIYFHQPGVEYNVSAKAMKEGTESDPLCNSFCFERTVGLYTDFDCINYGATDPGEFTFATGDTNLATDSLTIWNNGNYAAQVSVSSTKMIKGYTGSESGIATHPDYNNPSKTIEHFDAALWYKDANQNNVQVGYIQYMAGQECVITVTDLTPGYPIQMGQAGDPVLLQACRPAKIEFSVEPEINEGQESGDYLGFLTICVSEYTGTQHPVMYLSN